MRRRVLSRYPAMALAAALFCAACGNHAPSSPSAPSSPASPAPPAFSTGATIAGTVIGGSGSGISASRLTPSVNVGVAVTVVGTSITSPVDAAGHFSLLNVPPGHVQLQFSGAGLDAQLSLEDVGEREEIRVTIRINGAIAEIDQNERETADHNVEVEGPVTQVSASGFSVGDKPVIVPSGTPIVLDGRSMRLSDIQIGDRVKVRGAKTGLTITATNVELKTNHGNPGPWNNEIDLQGAVSSLSGGCSSSLSFVVSGKTVSTTASTQFSDGTCPQIANGTMVEVKGTAQANGSVSASRVQIKQAKEQGVELKGNVSGFDGICPSVHFAIGKIAVQVGSSTEFSKGACGQLADGVSVEVKGQQQANGPVNASRVDIEKAEENNEKVELSGAVSAKGGSCPNLTFTVSSRSVSTNASTEFKDTTCVALGNGDRVEVKGTKRSSGVVMASRVEAKK